MGTGNRYLDEEKLSCVKEYLEANVSITTFCRTKGINYRTFKGWIDKYEQVKETWHGSEINNGELSEIAPLIKDDKNETIIDEHNEYRQIEIIVQGINISCDKSSFIDVWRVISK